VSSWQNAQIILSRYLTERQECDVSRDKWDSGRIALLTQADKSFVTFSYILATLEEKQKNEIIEYVHFKYSTIRQY